MHLPNGKRVCKLLLKSLGILIMLFCMALYYDDHQGCCGEHTAAYLPTSRYSRELGLKRFDEESILQVYGAPATCIRWVDHDNNDRTLILDQYPMFDVLYVYADWYKHEPYNELIQITFKSETLRFGKRQIGIGSMRDDVQKAYRRDEKVDQEDLAYCAINFPGVEDGYYGESWCFILFCYDADGKVTSMAMQPSAFWGW